MYRGLAPYRLLIIASTFDRDELADARRFRPVGQLPVNLFSLPILCAQAEVAAVLGDVELLADAAEPLTAMHRSGVRWCVGWPLLVSRLLATASRILGRLDDAAQWCDVAAAEAATGTLRVARPASRSSYAHLAIARGDRRLRRPARSAVDAASAFDRLGMMPLHHVAERMAGDGACRAASSRTMLFTDLVDSTAMNVRRGDVEYVELLDQHNAIMRRRLRQFDGVELKHTGDGMASWFTAATAACECARSTTRDDLAEHNREQSRYAVPGALRSRFRCADHAPERPVRCQRVARRPPVRASGGRTDPRVRRCCTCSETRSSCSVRSIRSS